MTDPGHDRLSMPDGESTRDLRPRYDDAFGRALLNAERYVAPDHAIEIAHDVASEMVRLPEGHATPALIYVAVTSRLRDHWKLSQRRAAAEGKYHEMHRGTTPAWALPGSGLEVDELHQRIMHVVDNMPPAMREVFLLVREHELSYSEVAKRLGVRIGTVHTQLSRANALLRECVARYYAGRDDGPSDRAKGAP